uniref:Thiamin biosynthesis protein S n=1 Tax=Callithamnion tetricum TaxID=193179 RepID=A0A4D6WQP7_9FLOR|nr:Thiamin biosynthesis protein S [Callithamnion tetricum]
MNKLNNYKDNEYEYYPICINGQIFNCFSSMSLKDLLLYLNFNLSLVIVEYNKQIIDKEDWSNICLNINDSVEVITITGGG